jgi:hypothetical protein
VPFNLASASFQHEIDEPAIVLLDGVFLRDSGGANVADSSTGVRH